jgi:hypothetical protein
MISVTVLKSMVVSAEHPKNAYAPIFVTVLEVMVVSAEQSENAAFPI